jgi:hypothetical protein
MSEPRFSRRTILAALEILEGRFATHADLTRFFHKLGPEIAPMVGTGSISTRINDLISVIDHQLPADHPVEAGELLRDVIVERAVDFLPSEPEHPELEEAPWLNPREAALIHNLERDGFTVREKTLRRALPVDIGLPAIQSEVDRLLEKHRFNIPKGQLAQAIDAHARGNWAGANGQFRPFLEGLLEEITARLASFAGQPLRGHASRSKLASIGFLRRDLNEWDDEGRGFFNGLMNRLHPEGPHPGLSDDDDSTFRLHFVLLTAHLVLARFDTWGRE